VTEPAAVARWRTGCGALALLAGAVVLPVGAGCHAEPCGQGCTAPEICVAERCRLPCGELDACPNGTLCFRGYCEESDARPDLLDGERPGGEAAGDGDALSSVCGNATLEPGETCDGPALGSLSTCSDLGYSGDEALTCMSTCRAVDANACTLPPPTCGSGKQQNLEQCDGTDLDDATCESLGFSGGTLQCAANCSYDVTACTGP
jgi:hypothetical protein